MPSAVTDLVAEFNRPGLQALAEAGKPAPSAKSMYGRAGFTEVARRKLERPVERLTVAHFRRDRPTGSSAP